MASVTAENRRQNPFESWVLSRFGGVDAKQAISEQAEKLVQATRIKEPPVCMVKLAKAMGIDPWPIYESGTEGAIKIVDGRMRIVLRRSKEHSQRSAAITGRTRFTYAHELGHTLFYDLDVSPPARLAPAGYHRIEEQLCNKAASRFLVPEFLLKQELSGVIALSPEVFRCLAHKFQTSIQAIAYRLAESFSNKLEPNQFYMLSVNSAGFRGTGLEKPRCIICILGPSLSSQKISFLQSYQGIDHVKQRVQHSSLSWSLEEFFQKGLYQKSGSRVKSEEVVENPSGLILELKVCHSTMNQGGLVWSEGTLKPIETKNPF
jgi:hypothetical protein